MFESIGYFSTIILALAAVGGGVFLWRKYGKKAKAALNPTPVVAPPVYAPAPPVYAPAPTPTPVTPPVAPTPPAPAADPLGAGFANRAAFDKWLLTFNNATFLDGALKKEGFGPSLMFVTRADGSIVRQ